MTGILMNNEQLKQRVDAIISGRDNDSALAKVLGGIALFYGMAMELRSRLYQKNWLKTRRLPCRVISVGNLTLGGTGKTPMTIYMAAFLKSMGIDPVIVCRGYKGKYERSVEIVSDGLSIFLKPEESGDEPYLMASKLSGVPVMVGKDRYASGMKAFNLFKPDVIILDDGFQYLGLFRDLNLLLVDAANPVGNGYIFPRGLLREPSGQLERADALVITRTEWIDPHLFNKKLRAHRKPIFKCQHVPDVLSVLTPDHQWKKRRMENIRDKKCVAFSGIAKNEDFLKMLLKLGCRVEDFVAFEDHHQFSAKDVEILLKKAAKSRVEFLITTEKDRVKLPNHMFSAISLYSLGVRISFIGEDKIRFRKFVFEKLT